MPTQVHFLIAVSVWNWLRHLGGVGLVLLGLADNSVVPLPGSMDVLTILLAARHSNLWWYYAFMATVGAVIGGYITYGLARKGGKEAFERKLSKKTSRESVSSDSSAGDSLQWPYPLCCRRLFRSCLFCWRPAPCNTRAENLSGRWRWDGAFDSPLWPVWERFMAGTSSGSFPDITSRHCLRSLGLR